MLTNLALKMVIMITYLSHWDWILYKSRKDLIPYINSYEIHAMCPDGEFVNKLENIYKSYNILGNKKREITRFESDTLIKKSH